MQVRQQIQQQQQQKHKQVMMPQILKKNRLNQYEFCPKYKPMSW